MKFWVVILTVVSILFLSFLLVLNVAWRFLRMLGGSVDTFLNGKRKQSAPEDDNIIDITPEPVHSDHSDAEKVEIAAKAIADALKAASGNTGSLEDELSSLSRLAATIRNRQVKGFLIQIIRAYNDINAVFTKDEYNYRYTSALLAKCASGTDSELTNDGDDQRFAEGMYVAVKYICGYVYKISSLWNVACRVDDAELSGDMSEMLEKLEMFYWIRVAYPGRAEKDSQLLEELLESLANKLHMISNVNSIGVNTKEVLELLETSRATVKEMNVALDRMLESALSWDLLKADAMLETLRKELRLRGLY